MDFDEFARSVAQGLDLEHQPTPGTWVIADLELDSLELVRLFAVVESFNPAATLPIDDGLCDFTVGQLFALVGADPMTVR